METENTRIQLAVMNNQLKGIVEGICRIEKGNEKRDSEIDKLKEVQAVNTAKIGWFSAIISSIVSGAAYVMGRL